MPKLEEPKPKKKAAEEFAHIFFWLPKQDYFVNEKISLRMATLLNQTTYALTLLMGQKENKFPAPAEFQIAMFEVLKEIKEDEKKFYETLQVYEAMGDKYENELSRVLKISGEIYEKMSWEQIRQADFARLKKLTVDKKIKPPKKTGERKSND